MNEHLIPKVTSSTPPPPPPPPGGRRVGLTVQQQLRVHAATIAALVLSGRDAYNLGDVAVLEAADATVALALQIEPYIRDGAAGTGS